VFCLFFFLILFFSVVAVVRHGLCSSYNLGLPLPCSELLVELLERGKVEELTKEMRMDCLFVFFLALPLVWFACDQDEQEWERIQVV
jgi:hypothetical protein